MPHRPQGFRQRVNNTGFNQYNKPRSNQTSNITDFLGNWPTPGEALQQQLMKLAGSIERMDARMEKMERMESQQMNRWFM